MQAFISELNTTTGTPQLGSDHATVSNKYQNMASMFRYAIKPFMKAHFSDVIVEVYYNFDNRYGTPDMTFIYTFETNGIQCEKLPKKQ